MRHLFLIISLFIPFIMADVSARKKNRAKNIEQMSEEQLFMRDNFSNTDCSQWEDGRVFIYVDEKLSQLLTPQNFNETQHYSSYRGLKFVFRGLSDSSPWGGGNADIIFECNGDKYTYKTGKSLQEIKRGKYLPMLPMMVAQDEIERASALLTGKILYTRSTIWVDSLGNTRAGNKYFPISIVAVEPGNTIYPIAFVFRADSVTYRIYGSLSQTTLSQAATFDKLFTFENPRNQYPDIPDKHWQNIIRGRVCMGMNKNECRLALGRPLRVREIPTYSGLNEEWIYNSGAYLYFEDGILSRYR